jgi:hypothetical protein
MLPDDALDEAERLTRRARDAVDGNEAAAARKRRDALLAAHGYVARERVEDGRATLVAYPDGWVEDGVVRTERIEDVDRAFERPLEGPGEEDWDAVEAHNRAVAERVAEDHDRVHGANAAAFADFMSNHYARPVEEATRRMREEFLTEYFPRNAWPSDEQRAVVERSIEIVLDAADEVTPADRRGRGASRRGPRR